MGRNFDYPMPLEGRMAKSHLWAIEKDARELRKMLRDDDDIPGWVQAKIATAQDRIQVANRYLGHKIKRSEVGMAKQNPSTNTMLLAAAGLLAYVLYTSRD